MGDYHEAGEDNYFHLSYNYLLKDLLHSQNDINLFNN